MRQPTTVEEFRVLSQICRTDPRRYVQIADQWIKDNPQNRHAYFDRHIGYLNLGEHRRALDDLNKAIELDPQPIDYQFRGQIHRHLGEYHRALEDFDHSEALDPTLWDDVAFGELFRADCHARLGNESAALAACARLPEDFWTPGIEGAPSGKKAEIAEKLRVIAANSRGDSRVS